MSNKPHTTNPKSPADDLLGELESIKDLLEDTVLDNDLISDSNPDEHIDPDSHIDADSSFDDDLDIDIPILDDVVVDKDAAESPLLLNLEAIFDDDAEIAAPKINSPGVSNVELSQPEVTGAEEYSLDAELNLADLDTDISIPDFKLSTATSDDKPEPDLANDYIDDNSHEHLQDEASQQEPLHEEHEERFGYQDEAPTEPTAGPLSTDADFDIELLIQELVDDFIPTLEDKLRQRLSQCTPEVIRELAKK